VVPMVSRATPLSQLSQSPAPPRVKRARDKGKGKETVSRTKETGQRETRAYAAVQRVAKPLKPSPNILKQPMLVERSNDLRAIHSKTSMVLRRWFREGEVVWCALDRPIPVPEVPDVAITFWPAVVEEVKLKTEPIPRMASDSNIGHSSLSLQDAKQASSSAMQADSNPKDGKGPMLEADQEPLPWTIRQSTRYKVQLLAVSHSYDIPDDHVLPYQAHLPPDDLITCLGAFPAERLMFEKETLTQFNPCPESTTPSFEDAVSPYAAALQIAAAISTTWSITDEYNLKYIVSPSPNSSPKPVRALLPSRLPQTQIPPPSQLPPPRSLQQALDQASHGNAESDSIKVTSHSYYRNIQGVNPSMSQDAVEKTAKKVLGLPLPPGNHLQTRFQGMWWGAERIWTNDFIRLKVPRRMLAPHGSDNILAPSGPSKSTIALYETEGVVRDDSDSGAGSRGVFLRLDGIFAVNAHNEYGVTKTEPRVCGMLYELADEDWDEPTVQNSSDRDAGSGNISGAGVSPSQPDGPSQVGPSNTNGSAFVSNAPKPQAAGSPNPVIDNIGKTSALDVMLPQPPKGYRFRQILAPGYEFVGAMGLLSGRYYPRILDHPLLNPAVTAALERHDQGDFNDDEQLWALEGLSGGVWNSMDPHVYKKSRLVMMQDADRDAMANLRDYAQKKRAELRQLQTGDDSAMDVDEDIYA